MLAICLLFDSDPSGQFGLCGSVSRSWACRACARTPTAAYRDCWDRYRAITTSLGFKGHMTLAEAMT